MEYEPFEVIENEPSHTLLRCRYCGTLVHVSPKPPNDLDEDWDQVVAAMDLAESHLEECPVLVGTIDDECDEDDEDDYKHDYAEYGRDELAEGDNGDGRCSGEPWNG